MMVRAALPKATLPEGSFITVRLTRVGPRRLDDDNCQSSLKHVRDAIADVFGIDDGEPCWSWNYGQDKGDYAVRVTIAIDLAVGS